MQVLCAISGRDGSLIWEIMNNKTSPVIDIYAGSFIPDQNEDQIMDIVASHTIQKGTFSKNIALRLIRT